MGIFTSVSGTAPNRIFNIEWRTTYFSGGGTANYEVRLYEGQQKFDVVFGVVTQGTTSATSGVQGPTGLFTQYFCNGSGSPATGSVTYTIPPCNTPDRHRPPCARGRVIRRPPARPATTPTAGSTATDAAARRTRRR